MLFLKVAVLVVTAVVVVIALVFCLGPGFGQVLLPYSIGWLLGSLCAVYSREKAERFLNSFFHR